MRRPASGVFYGWWIVSASFLILFVTVGVGLYSPPVFLVPLQEHFGWSRAQISGGSAVAALVTGLASPLVGVWIDRFGARRVMGLGTLGMAGGFGLFCFMQSLWQLYAINALAAFGITCAAWLPNQTLIANWFSRRRGLAMGIALTGIGFGGMTMAPLADLLISSFGWRIAFAGLASGVAAVVIVVLTVIRSRPGDLGLLPDGEVTEGEVTEGEVTEGETDSESETIASQDSLVEGLEIGESLRTRGFWVLSLCNLLSVFASLSVVGHLVALLTDAGFASRVGASTLGLTIGVSVVGRLLFGTLADRFSKRAILSAAFVLHSIGVLLLFGLGFSGALAGFAVLFGLSLGGEAVLVPLLVGDCFGLRAFGKILGAIMISATLGAAIGPTLTGYIFDVTGTYRLALLLHIAALLLAATLVHLIPAVVDTRLRPEGSRDRPMYNGRS